MKTMANTIIEKMTRYVPFSVLKFMLRSKVIGLCYHVVSDKPLLHIKHIYPYKTPEMFEDDLVFLKQNYNLLSYEQLLEQYHLSKPLNPNSTFLSFDDGHSECFSIARPLLLKHEIPCMFFITTDFIDNRNMFYKNIASLCIERVKSIDNSERMDFIKEINDCLGTNIESTESFVLWILSLNVTEIDILNKVSYILEIDIEGYLTSHRPYLTSDEIKLLASDGFTIGAHTKKHPQLNLLNNDMIEEETVESCQIIRSLTGNDQIPFAFPFSGDGLDRDFLESVISRHKFIKLLFDTRMLRKDKDFIINRIPADAPSFNEDRTSTVPQLMRAAFATQLKFNIKNMMKPFLSN